MPRQSCNVCNLDNQEEAEALGMEARRGERSWLSAAKLLGLKDYRSLKVHVEDHYLPALERSLDTELQEAQDELQESIEAAVDDLFAQMRLAPAEVKPLYAAAIVNLRGLAQTKPSQQHLISALKTIQEMTGMKQEQRMMLLFAEQMFGELPAPPKPKALSEAVLDVTAIEDSFVSVTNDDQERG